MKDKILGSFFAPPSINIVDVLANSGYTLEAAIADIVDNSIAAQAKNIFIDFIYKGLDSKIVITDDGWGMDEKKLKEAITYANRNIDEIRDINDIGRYSIGLNSASSSFCDSLFLTSKTKTSKQNSLKMDFGHMRDTRTWEVFVCKNRDDFLIKSNSGTIVVWENLKLEKDPIQNKNILLNEDSVTSRLGNVELHLSKVFYRYIKYHGVTIKVNGNPIEGWDPFFSQHPNTQKTFEDEYIVNGSPIRIECYVLPVVEHLSPIEKEYEFGFNKNLDELQGFYLYRNDRLISIGGWLNIDGLNPTSKANYARIGIFVDNTLDKYLSVNFIKNSIILPSDLATKLKPIAKKVRSESTNNYDYKKKPRPYKKNKDLIDKPWITTKTPNGIKAQVNQNHPLIKSICKGLNAKQRKMLFDLLAKTLPISDFESYHGVDDYYSDTEMREMLEDKYNELIKSNQTKEEIFEMFKKTIPYCDKRYTGVLYDFIEEKTNE